MRRSATALFLLAGVVTMPAVSSAQDAPRADKPVIATVPKTDIPGPVIDLSAPSPKVGARAAAEDDLLPQVPAVRAAPRREAAAQPVDDRCGNAFLPVVGGNPSGIYECR